MNKKNKEIAEISYKLMQSNYFKKYFDEVEEFEQGKKKLKFEVITPKMKALAKATDTEI